MGTFGVVLKTLILCFTSLSLGILVLYRYKKLFKSFITNEWLRVNIVVLLMFEFFLCTIIPIFHDFQYMAATKGFMQSLLFFWFFVMLNVTPTVNAVLGVKSIKGFNKNSFAVQQAIIFLIIVIIPTLATLCLNYYHNHYSTRHFKWAIVYSVFSGSLAGIGYLFYTYSEYEKQQLLQARQLEFSLLNEMKVKAELDALHSKINPHFLYNALNSIADLTITDGRKARKMTIALSDLFRYTINYSNSHFSTVKEEIEMTETYLQIEKIRFEDKLNYGVDVGREVEAMKIPRFLLQPLVENAVKHGLAGVDKKGEIFIEVKKQNSMLQIRVLDNGKSFPKDLSPGYGLKNVFDKLKIFYKNDFVLEFINDPQKHVLIALKPNSAKDEFDV